MSMVYAHVPPYGEAKFQFQDEPSTVHTFPEEASKRGSDAVNSPNHYRVFPDMEAIDIIRKVLTREELIGAYKFAFLKYRLRAGEKDDVLQEIGKSDKFKEWLWEVY